jgi:ribose transport system substrate-binding protein
MNRSFLRFAAVVSLALAACGGAVSGTDAGNQTADAGQTPNPFYPQDLQDAVDRLTMELGAQPEAGNVRVAMVANRYSNFWNPAQIGTSRAAQTIGCVATFEASANGTVPEQAAIVDRKIAEGFTGIALSPIDSSGSAPLIQRAIDGGADVITFDSDVTPGSGRSFYMGTVNFAAGQAAGRAMIELLGSAGGEVVAIGGISTAQNALDRLSGIRDALMGSNVTLVENYFDELDFTAAAMLVGTALTEHPQLRGIITIYAYNGPIVLTQFETMGMTARLRDGSVQLVAFDLDPSTLTGLRQGTVQAAIGQRPYWFGYLGVHILFAMDRLGATRTMEILAPWLEGDVFDTGQDVVTPATLPQYQQYLDSLGITSS